MGEACDLLFNGVVFFGERAADNVYYCTDLSKVFVETLRKFASQAAELVDERLLERIRFVHLALRAAGEERKEFACAVLKWSGTLFNSQAKSSN